MQTVLKAPSFFLPIPRTSSLRCVLGLVGCLATIPLAPAQSSPSTDEKTPLNLPAQQVDATALDSLLPLGQSALDRTQLAPWGERNAAAALARLPGVNIESENGDARYVIIRGIDPTYNGVTINGASLATGSPENRATQLDGFELEGFDQIELTKVLLPDQPANAVGGLINFTSPSAFDYPSKHTEIGADLIYDPQGDQWGTGGFLRRGQLFADDSAGLFLTGSARSRSWINDAFEADPVISLPGGYLPNGEINFERFDIDRRRAGGSFNWEQKLPQLGSWFVRGSHNKFTDNSLRQRSSFDFEDAFALGSLTANGSTIQYRDNPNSSFDNLGVSQQLRDRKTNHELSLWGIGGEIQRRHWNWDFALNRASAQETENSSEIAYELLAPPPSLDFSIPVGTLPAVVGSSGGFNPSPNNFGLDEIATETLEGRETNWNGHLNLTREFDEQNVLRKLKFGTHFQFKRKRSEVEVAEYFGGPVDFDFLDSATPVRSTGNTLFPAIPRERLDQFLGQQTQFNRQREIGESVAGDYQSQEDILAAFAMADWTWRTSTLTAGARWEQSDFWSKSQNYDVLTDTVTPVAGSKRKDHLLPGIHFHYRSPDTIHSTDAWSWGAAYTQSLGRPGFEETKAGVFIEDEHVELGNASLNPLHSHNFDLSVAYERPTLGQFEAALFHKSIADFIYANRRNYDFDRDGEIDEIREFTNGSAGRISGIEFTYHNTVWGAPHTDRRLDFTTSATLVESEATYFDVTLPQPERKLPFIKQSDKLFRADLEWYHRAWRFRLSYHYRSGFLDELGEGTDDFEVLDYGQLDVAIGYQPTRDYAFYLRFENLTREPFQARWITSQRLAESEDLGINASLGITWTH